MRPRSLQLLAVAAILAATGCSGEVSVSTGSPDPGQEAERLIEGQLADEAELGPLTADCPDASGIQPGGSFDCTGTTEDGQVVEFTADVTEDGAGEVNSTNLAVPGDIPDLAARAAQALAEQNDLGSEPPPVTCDDSRGFLIEVGSTLDCEVTDPASGEVLGAAFTITDESGGFRIEITG